MQTRLFFLRTLSGLHCGVGQGLSDIDLPTAKESVSGYPFVPGSSIKGVFRDYHRSSDLQDQFKAAFGQMVVDDGSLDFAAALAFGDARLVCLPVRSYFGTFAYLTSPYALTVAREYLCRTDTPAVPIIPFFTQETNTYRAAIPSGSRLVHQPVADRVLLEDLDLLRDASQDDLAGLWASLIAGLIHPDEDESGEQARRLFIERFVIVDDDIMSFLCETALPVAARICIGEDGVVRRGALWYEEYVPPEAVFFGAVVAENGFGPHRDIGALELLNTYCSQPLYCQIGGNATIGRGLVTINFGGTPS